VTLTYNQKRSFQTVPGGICSIITFVLLTYYILVTIITKSVDLTYTETVSQSLLGGGNTTEIFNIYPD
jgi:hypothetical protein